MDTWFIATVDATFSLSAAEGAKTVYAKFKDSAGNESQIVNTVVILDTTPPTHPALANTPGRIAAATTSLQIGFSTASSDAAFKSYEVLGGQYTSWTEVAEPIIFSLTSADTWYTLAVRGKDRAGNVSDTASLRLFHGDRTILAGSAAQLVAETSRNASGRRLALP